MKRGSFVGKRKPINKVSAKVKAERPEFDAVYRAVDARSGGRCEAELRELCFGGAVLRRCLARAVEHHHVRKPRRSFHAPEWVIHLCRHHHDECSASYRVGRLLILPEGGGMFSCARVQKDSKFA